MGLFAHLPSAQIKGHHNCDLLHLHLTQKHLHVRLQHLLSLNASSFLDLSPLLTFLLTFGLVYLTNRTQPFPTPVQIPPFPPLLSL